MPARQAALPETMAASGAVVTLKTDKLTDTSLALVDAAAVSERVFQSLAGGQAEAKRASGILCEVGRKVLCIR